MGMVRFGRSISNIPTSHRSTISAHGLFIALAKNTVYNMAYEHQVFTSSLVFAQVQPPNVWWSADFKTISCDGDILTMDSMWEAIAKLIRDPTQHFGLK